MNVTLTMTVSSFRHCPKKPREVIFLDKYYCLNSQNNIRMLLYFSTLGSLIKISSTLQKVDDFKMVYNFKKWWGVYSPRRLFHVGHYYSLIPPPVFCRFSACWFENRYSGVFSHADSEFDIHFTIWSMYGELLPRRWRHLSRLFLVNFLIYSACHIFYSLLG